MSNPKNEMKEILQQLNQELMEMSILEIQEFKDIWLTELERLKMPLNAKAMCIKLIEQAIEIKASEVA